MEEVFGIDGRDREPDFGVGVSSCNSIREIGSHWANSNSDLYSMQSILVRMKPLSIIVCVSNSVANTQSQSEKIFPRHLQIVPSPIQDTRENYQSL